MKNETTIFGGGCFWCMEAVFLQLKGVKKVTSGYSGGDTDNPTYKDVCTGKTGHAEVVKIEHDPNIISFIDLLEVFWDLHDPTTLNRQGNDVGSQYRSIIFYTNQNQRKTAEKSLSNLDISGKFEDKVVTEIKELEAFYPAEKYHTNYYNNNSSQGYCKFVISPKLQHLKEKFGKIINTK
ncbi:peptide-methionine (S)-S-oxide reductase MsrA [Patescibacteria group bacterium]